jgi:hypothetical protein
MPLQRTRSRALLGRSPLNGGSLAGGSGLQRFLSTGALAPVERLRDRIRLGRNAPGAPRAQGGVPASQTGGGAPAGLTQAINAPPSNMPLQRTRSRALLGRSPLNGGSFGDLEGTYALGRGLGP